MAIPGLTDFICQQLPAFLLAGLALSVMGWGVGEGAFHEGSKIREALGSMGTPAGGAGIIVLIAVVAAPLTVLGTIVWAVWETFFC